MPLSPRRTWLFIVLGSLGTALYLMSQPAIPTSERLVSVRNRVLPAVQALARNQSVALGAPIYIRIFKESQELEMWLKPATGKEWKLVKIYPIATWGGGKLGPKLAEGDAQAPEGCYAVGPRQLNPSSNYHLAFNLGYPNAFDQAHDRTGSAIMVHGAKVSIGCFAMTDPGIEEIYLFAHEALSAGQPQFSVHSFPFRMTAERMKQAASDPNFPFWQSLQPIHDAFEQHHLPPQVTVVKGQYALKP